MVEQAVTRRRSNGLGLESKDADLMEVDTVEIFSDEESQIADDTASFLFSIDAGSEFCFCFLSAQVLLF